MLPRVKGFRNRYGIAVESLILYKGGECLQGVTRCICPHQLPILAAQMLGTNGNEYPLATHTVFNVATEDSCLALMTCHASKLLTVAVGTALSRARLQHIQCPAVPPLLGGQIKPTTAADRAHSTGEYSGGQEAYRDAVLCCQCCAQSEHASARSRRHENAVLICRAESHGDNTPSRRYGSRSRSRS